MVPSWWRHRRIARDARQRRAESRRRRRRPRGPRSRVDAVTSAARWTLTSSGCSGRCRSPSRSAGWRRGSDPRQWRREPKDSPKVYYKGLNLLLNEQHDKAIDAFIEAVQQDPDTSELHFALGNLFRQRGEYERAVRVHQHLLGRADLPKSERDRAQHGLAQDYLKAGLFDRAEAAYQALAGTVVRHRVAPRPARPARALARLAGRGRRSPSSSRRAAPARSRRASRTTGASSRSRPTRPPARGRRRRAGARARGGARATRGRWSSPASSAAARGDHAEALRFWNTLMAVRPAAFNLVAKRYAASARAAGDAARRAGAPAGALREDADARPARDDRLAAARRRRAARRACSPTCASTRRSAAAQALLARRRRDRRRGRRRQRRSAPSETRRGARRRAPRRPAAASLSLRGLRLRGRALLLAMSGLPRLGHLSAATPGGS